MLTRTLKTLGSVALTLTLAGTGQAANAQTLNFGVEATAYTGGYVGTGNVYTFYLASQTEAHAEKDPAGLQFGQNPNQQLYADVGSRAWATQGVLHGQVDSLAVRISATSFPTSPTAATDTRFIDTITVTSSTLPVGTNVTLWFRNAIDLWWQGSDNYDGNIQSTLQIGAVSATSRWTTASGQTATEAQSPLLEVKTKVGARLSVSGRLTTFARGSYFVPGPLYNGSMQIDAYASTYLESASGDVLLVADSGNDYHLAQN